MNRSAGLLSIFWLFVIQVSVGAAAQLGANNILVVTDYGTITEYTRTGTQVQAFTDSGFTFERPIRDIVTSGTTEIYAWNGTTTGYVGRLNTVTGAWTHLTLANFSVPDNITAGGIGLDDRYVFAADIDREVPPETGRGIVRFDFQNGSATRFATETSIWDVTIGLDRYLYSLGSAVSPGGTLVKKYNPDTLELLKTVNLEPTLGTEHRAIAVNASGEMYIGNLAGDIRHTDNDGVLLHNGTVGAMNTVSDVEIDSGGFLLITTRFGNVYKSDQNVTAPTLILTTSSFYVFGAVVQSPVGHLPVGLSRFCLE